MKPLSPYSIAHEIVGNDAEERQANFIEQFNTRGFDNTELWNLDITIAKFIHPRLIEFKKIKNGHPCNLYPKKWDNHLDKMIEAFYLLSIGETFMNTEEENIIIKEGLKLFSKYYRNLWD